MDVSEVGGFLYMNSPRRKSNVTHIRRIDIVEQRITVAALITVIDEAHPKVFIRIFKNKRLFVVSRLRDFGFEET